jgi:hypothetical protein
MGMVNAKQIHRILDAFVRENSRMPTIRELKLILEGRSWKEHKDYDG